VDRLEQIEAAIEALPPDEFKQLFAWFLAKQQHNWDNQMERDSAAGRLDWLFEEAAQERRQNQLREWPPAK
jgi:hypothetical protein